MNNGNYQVIEEIGHGAYGVVYKVRDENTDTIYALKKTPIIHDNNKVDRNTVMETSVLQNLKHPNIIQPIGYGLDGDDAFIIMPYLPHSLRKRKYPPHKVKMIMYMLFHAVVHMEVNKVIHRDIKPENILMNERDHPIIIDFGIASYDEIGTTNTNVVSLWWRTPSLIAGRMKYDNRIDVWSLGVIAYNILTGKHLATGNTGEYLASILSMYKEGREWYNAHKTSLAESGIEVDVRDGPYLREVLESARIPRDAIEFITYILRLEYEDIPTPMEVMMHPYFDGIRGGILPTRVMPLFPTTYPHIRDDVKSLVTRAISLFPSNAPNILILQSAIMYVRFADAVLRGMNIHNTIPLSGIKAGYAIPDKEVDPCIIGCGILGSCVFMYPPMTKSTPLLTKYALLIYEALGFNIISYIPSPYYSYI